MALKSSFNRCLLEIYLSFPIILLQYTLSVIILRVLLPLSLWILIELEQKLVQLSFKNPNFYGIQI